MENDRIRAALEAPDPSTRLQVALAAGTRPDEGFVPALIARSAVEPDFFVRDMLTWALTRHPEQSTVPLLLEQLGSQAPQARSQALHTLSKIGQSASWPQIPRELLHDEDDEVARTAWRAAVVLAPDDQLLGLAGELLRELGRGGTETRRSLSRALVAIGDDIRPLLAEAASSRDDAVSAHARATAALLDDPDGDFSAASDAAAREVLLRSMPRYPDAAD